MRYSTPLGITTIVLLYTGTGLLSACDARPPRPPSPNDPDITLGDTTTEKPVEGRVRLMEPIPVHGSGSVLVPLAVENEKRGNEERDVFARSTGLAMVSAARTSRDISTPGDAFWQSRNVRWHNALFSDLETGESWLLLDQRGVISQVSPAVPYEFDSETRQLVFTAPTKLIAFLVTTRDTTGDRSLRSDDARICMVTDGDGRDSRAITPEDFSVTSTRYDHLRDLLWLQVIEDTDGDGHYSGLDNQFPMVYDPSKDTQARRLIDASLVDQAEALLSK